MSRPLVAGILSFGISSTSKRINGLAYRVPPSASRSSKFKPAFPQTDLNAFTSFDMSNPYSSPTEKVSASNEPSPSVWGVRFGALFCGIATFGFIGAAVLLIPQAIRLSNDALQFPPEFQSSNDAAIRGSWVLGIASVCFACLNLVGVIMACRKRVYLAWTIVMASFLCFVGLAIFFRPG